MYRMSRSRMILFLPNLCSATPCRRRDLSFDSAEKGDSENQGCQELVAGIPG